jgi:hypothetical protein
MRTAVIVSSGNGAGIGEFLRRWGVSESDLYAVIVIEDSVRKSFTLPDHVRHYAYEDVPEHMGTLVPRHAAGLKNLGLYFGYVQGFDYFLLLDEDCYPSFSHPTLEALIHAHLSVLGRTTRIEEQEGTCFMGSDSGYAHGFPDSEKTGLTIPHKLSVGACYEDPDHDRRMRLCRLATGSYVPAGRFRTSTIQKGVAYVLTGGHACLDRDLVPYMYCFPAEGKYHKYGEIWLGFMLKRVMDFLGFAMVHAGEIIVVRAASSAESGALEAEDRGSARLVNDLFFRAIRSSYGQHFPGVRQLFSHIRHEIGIPYFVRMLSNHERWIQCLIEDPRRSLPLQNLPHEAGLPMRPIAVAQPAQ